MHQGGVVGLAAIKHNIYSIEIQGLSLWGGGAERKIEEKKKKATYVDWTFNQTWIHSKSNQCFSWHGSRTTNGYGSSRKAWLQIGHTSPGASAAFGIRSSRSVHPSGTPLLVPPPPLPSRLLACRFCRRVSNMGVNSIPMEEEC